MNWRNMMGVSRDEYQKNKTPQNLRKIRKNPDETRNKPIIGNIANNANSIEKVKTINDESGGECFFDDHMAGVIADLNRIGIRMLDVPEAKRQEAFALEGELAQTANAGNREEFLSILKRWRRCFH